MVGVEGLPVQVEVDLAQGLPSFSTVGLAEGAVREAKDRVRAAIKNAGYEFPQRRITVNLAPAAVKKEGSGYDLPIALGILAAAGIVDGGQLAETAITGELSLDGSVRPVPGVLPMALAAQREGIQRFLVPAANAREAAMVQGIEVFGIERLDQAVEFCLRDRPPTAQHRSGRAVCPPRSVSGRFRRRPRPGVRQAGLEIAAAGGHNLLLDRRPRDRQDDDGPAAADHPAGSLPGRGPRDHQDLFHHRAAACG